MDKADRKVESITAQYFGPTTAGTVVSKDNIRVTVTYDNTEEETKDFTVDSEPTLAAEESVNINVSYGEYTTVLTVTCTDKKPFQSEVYEGSGDDVINIDTTTTDAWYLHIEFSGDSHFSVTRYDSSNNYVDPFVNTVGNYSGNVIDSTLSTKALEIKSNESWKVEARPVLELTKHNQGESITGSGADVMLVSTSVTTASISCDGDSHFAVWACGASPKDLLVNTIAPYSGTVMLRNNPFLIYVESKGNWTINLN